jgi:16S rRNA (guanine527-N7)-methyltransferase
MGQEENRVNNLLEEGLLKLGIGEEKNLSTLVRYIEEIELFNPAYGLVKVQNRDELIVKHILDSLAPLNILRNLLEDRQTTAIADVGSGAGLPGIPLAICMQKAEFTLIERMGRRAGFLRDVLAVMGLSNVRVEEADAEKLSSKDMEGFDLIVFRAFRPLDKAILARLLRLLAPGGFLAAYKGRREAIKEEMDRLFNTGKDHPKVDLQALTHDIIPLEVPFLQEERHLLIISRRGNDKKMLQLLSEADKDE